ncbi:MAG: hypothetical protein WD231_01120 [Candidatus Woykebacteria bacterium]
MFLKLKNLLQKKFILIFALVFATALLVAPKFLADKQESNPQSSKTEVSDQTDFEEALTNQTDITSVDHENPKEQVGGSKKIQGTTTQQTTKSNNTPTTKKPTSSSQASVIQEIALNINTGSANYSYSVARAKSMTVYDVLVKASNENKFSLVSSWYGAPLNSQYIIEIHGFNCGCWTYTLKDKYGVKVPGSGEGASLDTVKPGNIIIWKTT